MSSKVTFKGSFMQSFSSMGPMLDFAALFSAIAFYSGSFLGLVMVIAFIITFATMYVVYSLSSKFQSNGGYYFFVGRILGKNLGIAVSIMYVIYAMLVIPDISFFISYFSLFYIRGIFAAGIIWMYLIPMLFLLAVTGIVSLGLGKSIKYTIAAGSIELVFLLILDILLFTKAQTFAFPIFPRTGSDILSVFNGVVFGILAFSGNGSSIFLSEDTVNGTKTVPKGITYSYIITGIVLILSAFALVSFLGIGGVALYTINPFFVVTSIKNTFGLVVYALFGIMGIVSATNLSVSYGNALFNATKKMVMHSIIPATGLGKSKILLLFILVEGTIIELSTFLLGSVTAFIVVAALVSFSYMIVHVVTGVSLMKLSADSKKLGGVIPALISAFILSITFVFSVTADIFSGFPGRVSVIAFAVIAVMALLAAVIGMTTLQRWYSGISFSRN